MTPHRADFLSALAVAVLLSLVFQGQADDWYRWRGPHLDGISRETNWNPVFPKAGPQQLWKASVGLGYSSTVVADARLFTKGNTSDVDTIYCLDAETGRELWKYSYPCKTNPKYYEGGTSSTPTVDGAVVYSLSREGDVHCLEAASGKVTWSKNIARELGLKVSDWGYAGSPLVSGDLLILNVGTYGTALEKKTGNVVWQTGNEAAGYATPVPFVWKERECLAVFGAKALAGVETRTGKVLWQFPWQTKYDINAADPIVHDGKVFISSGYRAGGALLDLSNQKPEMVWTNQEMHNQLNAAVLMDGYLYGISGQSGYVGELRCVRFADGQLQWKEPSTGLGALTVAGDKLIVIGEKGELMIVEVNPREFRWVSRAQVIGGKCWTAPVLANGRIYVRNAQGDLVCVDVREKTLAGSEIVGGK